MESIYFEDRTFKLTKELKGASSLRPINFSKSIARFLGRVEGIRH
jgi:hypothetical protein